MRCWLLGCMFRFLGMLLTEADPRHSSSTDTESPFPRLLNDAMILPLSSGGNVGIRRRQLEALIAADNYQLWSSTYGPLQ